ncbi:MAG: hypothetical protein ACREMA_16160, partial [Longimicrobiales bacterium]
NPARAGETVVIFASGLGQTNPAVRDGDVPSGPIPITGTSAVTIGGQAATVQYAGKAPGFAGLYQVNAVVPSGLAPGTHDLVLRINNVPSNTVTLAVR